MAKFLEQTRVIKVIHPSFKNIVLFEAHVKITRMRKDLVEKIKDVKIEYQLKTN